MRTATFFGIALLYVAFGCFASPETAQQAGDELVHAITAVCAAAVEHVEENARSAYAR